MKEQESSPKKRKKKRARSASEPSERRITAPSGSSSGTARTASSGSPSSRETRASASSGSKKKGKRDQLPNIAAVRAAGLDPIMVLAAYTGPLLELAAVVDDVFTETDAFDPTKLRAGQGRIYRAWKAYRVAVDPNFKDDDD